MLIPQIIIVEEVLPEVRRITSRALYSDGWSQGKIAELFGTSQAMVSRYLKEKRESHSSLDEMITSISGDMEVAAKAGCTGEELVERFCSSLDRSMSAGGLVKRYEERFGIKAPGSCYGSRRSGSSRAQVLEDLEIAVSYLMDVDIADLVPAVKVNMASAQEGASSPGDVVAFPGRIPDRAGRILRPLPPEFGVSRHLAGTLLDAMRDNSGIRSAMNLALTGDIRKVLEGMEECAPLKETDAPVGYLIDPGGFGIEPCLYIFADSPLVLARFAVEVQKKLFKEE